MKTLLNNLLLSGLFLVTFTLSCSTYASDETPLPDVVKTPSPANPVPIPYPNIRKGADKPDSKEKGIGKRVVNDFDRRGLPRFNEDSKYKKSD